MIAGWVVVAVLGLLGVWGSYRLGLLAGSSRPKVAACLAGLLVSMVVVVFALGMVLNSGETKWLAG